MLIKIPKLKLLRKLIIIKKNCNFINSFFNFTILFCRQYHAIKIFIRFIKWKKIRNHLYFKLKFFFFIFLLIHKYYHYLTIYPTR
jgi:hypothetical protein